MDALNKDIFDESGRLLLSKNTKLTPRIIKLLSKHGLTWKEQMEAVQQEAQMDHAIHDFSNRIAQHNVTIFSNATKILTDIFDEAKEKPWGLYVNILANYNTWIYTHSINVALLSLMMAIKINDDEEIQAVGLGAFFHDVGKLLIPTSIVNKRMALSEEEFKVMKQHCELGENSLANYGLNPLCLKIVKQHHERLDGSGYPNGLKDDQIAYGAKIVMIADSIDAITCSRPYKKAQSLSEAMNRLTDDSAKYSAELLTIAKELLVDHGPMN